MLKLSNKRTPKPPKMVDLRPPGPQRRGPKSIYEGPKVKSDKKVIKTAKSHYFYLTAPIKVTYRPPPTPYPPPKGGGPPPKVASQIHLVLGFPTRIWGFPGGGRGFYEKVAWGVQILPMAPHKSTKTAKSDKIDGFWMILGGSGVQIGVESAIYPP